MIEPYTETDDLLALIDDLDVADIINAAFAIEVALAHQTDKTKDERAPSSHRSAKLTLVSHKR